MSSNRILSLHLMKAFYLRPLFLILLCSFSFLSLQSQDSGKDDEWKIPFEKAKKHMYRHQDSAYIFLEKAYDLSVKKTNWENAIDVLLKVNEVAEYHYNLEKLKGNLQQADSLFLKQATYLKKLPNNLEQQNTQFYYTGLYYYRLYDYANARAAFQQIIDSIEKLSNSETNSSHESFLSVSYSYIAKMYVDEGKYELAKEIYSNNIRQLRSQEPKNANLLFSNYSLLAEAYKLQGDHKKANDFLLKTLSYDMSTSGNEYSLISTSFNIAQNYVQLAQLDSALYYLNIAKEKLSKKHIYESNYHQVRAEILAAKGEDLQALSELNKSLEITNEKFSTKKTVEKAKIYLKIGNQMTASKQTQNALKQFNLGIAQLDGKSSQNSSLNQAMQIKLTGAKSKVLNILNTTKNHNHALETVDFGIQALDSLKPTFQGKTDKLALIDDTFPLFESGLEAAYKLYNTTKDKKYIAKAFAYSEKSKDVLLLEALLSAKATEFANIPKILLEKEQRLKSEIVFVEKRINRAKEAHPELEKSLFDLKQAYRNLTKTLEKDYPAYFNLKYNSKLLSLKSLQELLPSDNLMVSYFYGQKNIYTFGISKNQVNFFKVAISAKLEKNILNLRSMLGNPKSDVGKLGALSYDIYAKILQPIHEQNSAKKIVFIPDGILNYLPFGSLNTSKKELRYLIEKVQIGYSNSATLWSQLILRKASNDKLLAFAPSFNGTAVIAGETRNSLLPLPHNTTEVENIMEFFKGDAFSGSNASLQQFNSNLTDYGVLHMATHGNLDDANPEYSYLAFTPNQEKDYLLYAKDIYNLELNAELITLSACETGVGKLRKGEGFISLARSFFYSGAASISSTLWKINDASSSKIMTAFYENLAKGETKDQALQNAKVDFLKANSQNALAHPYYWSGFIVSGNTAALVSSNNRIWIGVLGILILLIMLLFTWRKSATQVH